MRIGITIGAAASNRLQAVVARARELEALGFSQLWMVQAMGLDAITALSVAGSHTSAIGLGTSVVPTSPRHPVVMAQQALTAAAASGGRFTLGIGTSHRLLIEDMFGLPFTQPARHMREYLEVLNPLLNGERVKFRGEHFQVNSSA